MGVVVVAIDGDGCGLVGQILWSDKMWTRMTKQKVVVGDGKSVLAMEPNALFTTDVKKPSLMPGGYIKISKKKLLQNLEITSGARINAWIESMRASSPTFNRQDKTTWMTKAFCVILLQHGSEKIPLKVPFPQGGRYRAAALGFYQRDNGNPSYQERRQTMEESLSKFMVESTKIHDENSNLIKEIQASADAAIRNQGASIKALEIQIGQISKKMVLTELIDRKESATNLKRSLMEKPGMGYQIQASTNTHDSTILKDYLSPNEKDPGSFSIPCYINNIYFKKALADLGASVSVMPYSTFINLDLGELVPTKLIIELADRTIKRPKGIAENVLVGIDKFVFPVDFVVLDMPGDIKVLLILGRPFLSTAHAKIDVFKRKITLRVGGDQIVFKSDKPTSNIIKRVFALGLRERMEFDLEARLMGETLILSKSLNPTYGDYIKLNDLNEPLELRRNQVEDLGPTIKECEVIDEPMEDIVETRYDDNEISNGIDEYPSFCDFDRKIHIDCAYNLQFSCMIVMENMDAY
ncbi:ribonuclease H-like domain, reverse transcriptase, RNA-dependent DNA polymerase [Tanacetum coccineum]